MNKDTIYIDKLKELRNRKPLFSNNELNELLSNKDHVVPEVKRSILRRIIRKSFMIIIPLILLITASITYIPSDDKINTDAYNIDNYNVVSFNSESVSSEQNFEVSKVHSENIDKNDTTTKIKKLKSGKNKMSDQGNHTNTHVFTIKKDETTPKLINPDAVTRDNPSGQNIPGIIVLELTKDEFKKLNIDIDDKYCTFNTETITRIHPIPLRRNYYHGEKYREMWRYHIPELLEAGYDTTGLEFFYKTQVIINLNQQDIENKKDSLQDIIDNLFGNETIYISDLSTEERKEFNSKNDLRNKLQVEMSELGMEKKILDYKGWKLKDYSRFAPVFFGCSYNNSNYSMLEKVFFSPALKMYKFNKEPLYDYNNYEEMIPVRIRFDKEKSDNSVSSIIFWFMPSRELIKALPERYSAQLEKELELIDEINSKRITPHEACIDLSGKESMLGICNFSADVFDKLLVNPNPVVDEAIVTLELKEARVLTMNIYDANGRYISNIDKDKSCRATMLKVNVDLSDLAKGIYLLSITTDRGEQIIQRIIKL